MTEASIVDVGPSVIRLEVGMLREDDQRCSRENGECLAHDIDWETATVGEGGVLDVEIGSTGVDVDCVGDPEIVSVEISLEAIPVATGRLVAVTEDSIVDVGPFVIRLEVGMLRQQSSATVLEKGGMKASRYRLGNSYSRRGRLVGCRDRLNSS